MASFVPVPYNKYNFNNVIFYLNKSKQKGPSFPFLLNPSPFAPTGAMAKMVGRGDNHCILHIKSQDRTIPEHGTPSFARCRVPKSEPVPECFVSGSSES